MDNRIFNVNGRTKRQLAHAIELLLLNEYDDIQKIRGWYLNSKKGLVLTWYTGENYKAIPFTNRMGQPTDIQSDELVDILWDWLSSAEAKCIKPAEWEGTCDDPDIGEEDGWRLYTEDWGHINETEHSTDHYSVVAFKPVKLWYGK